MTTTEPRRCAREGCASFEDAVFHQSCGKHWKNVFCGTGSCHAFVPPADAKPAEAERWQALYDDYDRGTWMVARGSGDDVDVILSGTNEMSAREVARALNAHPTPIPRRALAKPPAPAALREAAKRVVQLADRWAMQDAAGWPEWIAAVRALRDALREER